jgi:hypothetical protein
LCQDQKSHFRQTRVKTVPAGRKQQGFLATAMQTQIGYSTISAITAKRLSDSFPKVMLLLELLKDFQRIVFLLLYRPGCQPT